ncbi:MAG: hypothetical protein FWE16_05225 [Firmicutes bacterium]|nr:hypothetical protein [Bacillota bacterium]
MKEEEIQTNLDKLQSLGGELNVLFDKENEYEKSINKKANITLASLGTAAIAMIARHLDLDPEAIQDIFGVAQHLATGAGVAMIGSAYVEVKKGLKNSESIESIRTRASAMFKALVDSGQHVNTASNSYLEILGAVYQNSRSRQDSTEREI